jgi:hypothetical protein
MRVGSSLVVPAEDEHLIVIIVFIAGKPGETPCLDNPQRMSASGRLQDLQRLLHCLSRFCSRVPRHENRARRKCGCFIAWIEEDWSGRLEKRSIQDPLAQILILRGLAAYQR